MASSPSLKIGVPIFKCVYYTAPLFCRRSNAIQLF